MKSVAQHSAHDEPCRHGGSFIQRSVDPLLSEEEEMPFVSAKRLGIQPKLTIGAPNDLYEQEADAMAEHVMRMPLQNETAPIVSSLHSEFPVQRMCSDCEEEIDVQGACDHCEDDVAVQRSESGSGEGHASSHIAGRLQSRQGQGSPLPPAVQTQMGRSFGTDFSSVRIHTDTEASQMSQDLNAQAFTHGSDIYFNQGKFDPVSPSGKRLLAHELTHTVQQGKEDRIQRQHSRRRRPMTEFLNPKLCLYQADDADTPEHARSYHPDDIHVDSSGYFRRLASRKAREIGAIQFDYLSECPTNARIGAIPYLSGADIIEAISKVYLCTGHQIRELHIFSHGFTGGLGIVASHQHRRGLLTDDFPRQISQSDREAGVRQVSDIPVEPFSDDSLIVFHGCNIGYGESGFAEQVLRHLLGTRPDIRIFAHYQSGAAGNFDRVDWMEFSSAHQDGRRRTSTSPYDRYSRRIQRKSIPKIQKTPADESVRLSESFPALIIGGGPFSSIIQEFRRSISAASNYSQLLSAVESTGISLWTSATSQSQTQSNDDRPLYWTRLQMNADLRNFVPSGFRLSSSGRRNLLSRFEWASRGMLPSSIRWRENVKKVLISGFDPFQLDNNIRQSNPSGAAALALDGQTLDHPSGIRAEIQAVIIPVNFGFFDQGNIETFFERYIQTTDGADMVMTLSQGGTQGIMPSEDIFEVEHWAGRYRHPDLRDNSDEPGGSARHKAPGSEFISTSLPAPEMRNVLGRAIPDPRETSFSGIDSQGVLINEGPGSPETITSLTSRSGSGGNYLSNEIFYRTSLLRVSSPNRQRRLIPVGHLHTPRIPDSDQDIYRTRITRTVRDLIIAGLPTLNS